MSRLFILLLIFGTLIYFTSNTFAQVNDCIEIEEIECGAGDIQFTSSSAGRNDFGLAGNDQGCLATGEHFSAWFKIRISQDGILTFVIEPDTPTDYDFAVYGPDVECGNLGSPIRCSYAAGSSNTGLNMTSTDLSEGAGGDRFVRYMDVLEGETYYIIVDNFSSNSSGFVLSWGPTGDVPLAASSAEFEPVLNCNIVDFENESITCEGTLTYEWDFGDGTSSTEENPTHVYAIGTYDVSLTVTVNSSGDNNGETTTTIQQVVITEETPVATITGLEDNYCQGAPYTGTLTLDPPGGELRLNAGIITTFDPSTLSPGDYTLRYSYVNPANTSCVSVEEQTFSVIALPTISFTGVADEYCAIASAFVPQVTVNNFDGSSSTIDATPFLIEKDNGDGTFTTIDAAATNFDPAAINTANGGGTYRLSFNYSDPTSPANCENTTTIDVDIVPTPEVVFANLQEFYCIGAAVIDPVQINITQGGSTTSQDATSFLLEEDTGGGVYTTIDAAATSFDPTGLGVGNYRVSYDYVDAASSCTIPVILEIQVALEPSVNIENVATDYCQDDPSFTLEAFPTGGTFSIDGTTVTTLNPADWVGTHTVRYDYTDPNEASCTNFAEQTFSVRPLPSLNFTGVAAEYCALAPAFVPQVTVNRFDGSSPTINATPFLIEKDNGDGTFTTIDAAATSFDPVAINAANGAGTYRLSFTYSDPTNPAACENSTTVSLEIVPAPEVAFNNLQEFYCIGANVINPVQVSITQGGSTSNQNVASFLLEENLGGGVYNTINASATSFDPTGLGVGNYRVSYDYVDAATSCTVPVVLEIQVALEPTVNIENLDPTYCQDDASFTLEAFPNGGTFSIGGTTITQLNPADWVGTHTLRYDYTDPNEASCTNFAEQTFTVYNLATLAYGGDTETGYCVSEGSKTITLVFTNADGSTTAPQSINFSPSALGVGSHEIVNGTYTDPTSGCEISYQRSITVHPLPNVTTLPLSKVSYCGVESPEPFRVQVNGTEQVATGFDVLKNGSLVLSNVDEFAPSDLLDNFGAGDFTLRYAYQDANGCGSEVSVTTRIEPNPDFRAFPKVTRKVCPPLVGYKLFAVEPEPSGAIYRWRKDGEADYADTYFVTLVKPEDSGLYEVEISDGDGCPTEKHTYEMIIECRPSFDLPNAFSPNGDGLNDVFTPFGGDFVKLDWRIYNRWGHLVFTGDDLNKIWDGTQNGKPAPTGTYIWKATYENILEPGIKVEKTGKVTVVY